MTENTPQDHHSPIDGTPKLVQAALPPFRALLWTGLVLALIGLIAAGVGGSKDGTEEFEALSAFAFSGGCFQWAVPFFVGAGIIAGLGKRESYAPNTKPAAADLGQYVPVDE